jgi:SEC-C motif-containing protein
MRSRYSACCLELVDYLLATTHATTKSRYNRAELTNWLQQNNWCSLQVVSTTDNGNASEYVDFVAYYQQGAQLLQHREYSQFKRETDQRWYFVGGEHRPDITVERNQSCPCGSAKKHKQCCL